jgi:CBS domain-containing protein
VAGLVSEYDLLACAEATAAEVMTTAVVSVTGDTDIEEVRRLFWTGVSAASRCRRAVISSVSPVCSDVMAR